MENELKRMLEEEIKTELVELSNLTPGTVEHNDAVDKLSVLYKLKIEETRAEKELLDAANARESELQLKREQLSEQAKDRCWKFGLEVGCTAAALIFDYIWMRRGFRFEETGTYTSKTFTNLISRFKRSRH